MQAAWSAGTSRAQAPSRRLLTRHRAALPIGLLKSDAGLENCRKIEEQIHLPYMFSTRSWPHSREAQSLLVLYFTG